MDVTQWPRRNKKQRNLSCRITWQRHLTCTV